MKSQYPTLPLRADLDDVSDALRAIARLRQTEDLPDFTNLNQLFVSGRSSSRIPVSAADVQATDVQGDISYATDGSYMYVLINNGSGLVWARIPLDTSW